MIPALAFVAPLVVAGEAGHQLLIGTVANVTEELGCTFAAQRCRSLPVVSDDDITVLLFCPRETVWAGHSTMVAALFDDCVGRQRHDAGRSERPQIRETSPQLLAVHHDVRSHEIVASRQGQHRW